MKPQQGRLRGFKRCDTSFASIVEPPIVFTAIKHWFNGKTIPDEQRDALEKLSEFAELVVPHTRRSNRIRPAPRVDSSAVFEALMVRIFGLDLEDPKLQFFYAIARAYLIAWHFADLWAERSEHLALIKKAQRTAWFDPTRRGLARINELAGAFDLLAFADTMEASKKAGAISKLLDTFHHKALTYNVKNLRKAHAARSPKRFLLLRLAEVYAVSLELPTPLHESDKFNNNSEPPDQKYARFARAVFRLVNFPNPNKKLNSQLRMMRSEVRKYQLDSLSGHQISLPEKISARFRIYADLNSTAWLSDYDWVPEMELGLYERIW